MEKPIRTIITLLVISVISIFTLQAKEVDNQPGVGLKEATFEKVIQKSSESTDKIVGQEVDYCLWYNPNKWELLKENLNNVAEYSFKIDDGDAFAMIIPEEDITPLEDAPYIIFEGAKHSGVEDIKILKMENHLVNGVEVLYLIWSGKIMDTKFTYMYNIYSGKEGTVQVVAYTLDDLVDDKKEVMEELLNGFCIPEKS